MNNDMEYQQHKIKFDQYYNENVLPQLMSLEKKRKKMLRLFLGLTAFAAAWLCLTILRLPKNIGDTGNLSAYAGLINCIIILLACWPMFHYYHKSKENLLSLLIRFWGDFSYTHSPNLSDELLNDSKIMKAYDKLTTDDSFTGKYDDILINITEYVLYQKIYVKTKQGRFATFRKKGGGVLFSARMNKIFSGQTIVVKDKGWLNSLTHYKNLQRAGMESPEFEKVFEVYTDNQIEARFLLTTTMIEHLLVLKKYFPKIELSFFKQNLLINIETSQNLFECSNFFRSVINKKRIEKSFKELYLLFSIVEILQLNQKKIF